MSFFNLRIHQNRCRGWSSLQTIELVLRGPHRGRRGMERRTRGGRRDGEGSGKWGSWGTAPLAVVLSTIQVVWSKILFHRSQSRVTRTTLRSFPLHAYQYSVFTSLSTFIIRHSSTLSETYPL